MSLDGLAMTVLIVAILVAASALILEEFRDSDAMVTSSTNNETITSWANNTGKSLTYPLVTSITSIGNATYTVGSGNYTLTSDSNAASVTMIYIDSAGTWATGDYWVSYTYDAKSVAYNSTDDGLDAVGDVSGWLSIIVIIMIAVFIIYLVRQLGSSSA